MANLEKMYKAESRPAYQLLDMFGLKHFLQSIPRYHTARVPMALHRDLDFIMNIHSKS